MYLDNTARGDGDNGNGSRDVGIDRSASGWTTAAGGASLLGSDGFALQPDRKQAPKQNNRVAGCLKLFELIV
jgi:hypothetical protein